MARLGLRTTRKPNLIGALGQTDGGDMPKINKNESSDLHKFKPKRKKGRSDDFDFDLLSEEVPYWSAPKVTAPEQFSEVIKKKPPIGDGSDGMISTFSDGRPNVTDLGEEYDDDDDEYVKTEEELRADAEYLACREEESRKYQEEAIAEYNKKAAVEKRWADIYLKHKIRVGPNDENDELILEFTRAVGLMTDDMKKEARTFIEQQYIKLKEHYNTSSSESSGVL